MASVEKSHSASNNPSDNCDGISSPDNDTVPDLAHTPPPDMPQPNLAHTPPPLSTLSLQSPSDPSSHLPQSPMEDRPVTLVGSSDPSSPEHSSTSPSPDECSEPVTSRGISTAGYSILAGSPPSVSGQCSNTQNLGYSGSHPSSGVYSASASLGSIYGTSAPGAVGRDEHMSAVQHRREASMNSMHSVNSFREFYDKSSLNKFMSSSPKLSNRDIEMNRMSGLCGSLSSDYGGLTEMFTDPVEEKSGERIAWEFHNVTLMRVPGYGFGIAVSGGRDNPHFRNGDPSIAISDVLKAGPAEGKLELNDRLITANGISLENVDYNRAVQVLRDSGASVQLVVKRRVILPYTAEQQTMKLTLMKRNKKEDFGIVLGCQVYVKEILNKSLAEKEGGLREGDVLLRINSTSTENLTLKEARKLVDSSKEKLHLLVRRDGYSSPVYGAETGADGHSHDSGCTKPSYSIQNLYVQPPTRGPEPLRPYQLGYSHDPKNNIRRFNQNMADSPYGEELPSPTEDANPPPRPPLPRPEDYYTRGNASANSHSSSPAKSKGGPLPDPRIVSFKKEGSVGIRLTGGNEVGIYVTAVQPGSQAQLQGLIPGDKIIKVNDMDMSGVTREEAVLYLMSLQDQIDLIVQTRMNDYQHILNTQKGDRFYIKTHFHYEPNGKAELSFRSGDIFRVMDTLHGGVVGAWQVHRIGRNNQETQSGIIPNKARAEELATAQFNAAKKEQTQSESRGGFFKRRRNSRRSKSLGKDHWEDVVFADAISKFPAYERVTLRHPGFVRPVVLFGPLADIASDRLLKDNPDKLASPQLDSSGEKPSGIVRLSAIREIMDKGKHAVLDITPNAVDRLNYAQFYPIVVFLRAESKQIVKELRSGLPKGRMSSKKLFDQSVKLEKLWGHVFTATISLTQPDTWYRKVKEIIEKQQASPIWMSETKPAEALSDDFLFPMTSRLSYASSPESDLEMGPESRTPSKSPQRFPQSHGSYSDRESRSRIIKSSSDPSLTTQDDAPLPTCQPGPPPYSAGPPRGPPPTNPDVCDTRRKSQGGDSKYGFASGANYVPDSYPASGAGVRPYSGGGGGGTTSQASSPGSPFPYLSSGVNIRNIAPPLSLPPSYSPKQHPSGLNVPVGQSPPKSLVMPGHFKSSSSHLNGHQGGEPPPAPAPEVPPKVDRSSKPGRIRSGQDFGAGKDLDLDCNYMNTARGSSLERQSKMVYDSHHHSPLEPNVPDDLKSTFSSPDPYSHYGRSLSHPPFQVDDQYRLSDYKPVPPPKTSLYKPVPPPKPKQYRSQSQPGNAMVHSLEGAHKNGGAAWSNYSSQFGMYDRGDGYYSGIHVNNGGLSDDYSGLDSGQGSSLDRKYDTFGRATSKQPGPSGRAGYYLNVPPPRDLPPSHSGHDLPNHDHRGSAFELYKKPSGPPLPHHHQPPMYIDHSNRFSLAEDGNHVVIATARGVFGHKGGTLTSEETGVSITIPPGALSKGSKQEIYFKVCQDATLVPPLDQEKGETLLSPLVMCGPHGLKFERPVELRLPHAASVSPNTWSFALKSSDTPSGLPTSWTNTALSDTEPQSAMIDSNYVSVLVDHF